VVRKNTQSHKDCYLLSSEYLKLQSFQNQGLCSGMTGCTTKEQSRVDVRGGSSGKGSTSTDFSQGISNKILLQQ
jgi:hypothetical protein